MLTANEKFSDALIRHNIIIKRRTRSVTGNIRKDMEATNEMIRQKYSNDSSTKKSIIRTQEVAINYRELLWGNIMDSMSNFRNNVYKYERGYIERLASRVYPIEMRKAPKRFYKEIRALQQKNSPMRVSEPKVFKQEIKKLRTKDLSTTRQIMQMAEKEKWTPDMLSAGLKSKNKVVLRDLETIGLTQAKEQSTQALTSFVEANSDIIDKVRWVATLDTRTTMECADLDGKEFPINEGLFPPRHWNCRCERVPIVSDLKGAVRPANPVSEKEAMRDFAKENNIKIPKAYKRDNLPRGYKTKYDQFLRNRLRERIGTVPATVNYETWLKRQSLATQEAAIGSLKKAKQFRDGEITLAQLAKKH